jgi:uncharacterized RmlC-like cupin family protein
MVELYRGGGMAKRIRPRDRRAEQGEHPGLSREIAISNPTVGSQGIYAFVLVTPPGGSTRKHHHGECETSIYVVSGRAKFTWGATGTEHELIADPGDFVYIPAGEVHSESNVSLTEPLEVVVTRNCPEAVTIVVD